MVQVQHNFFHVINVTTIITDEKNIRGQLFLLEHQEMIQKHLHNSLVK